MLAAAVATSLVLTLSAQASAAAPAQQGFSPPKAKSIASVPVKGVPPVAEAPAFTAKPEVAPPAASWPTAGTADFAVAAGATPAQSRPGGLRVQARPSAAANKRPATAAARMRVTVLDRPTTERAHVRGVVLDVSRTDGVTTDASVDLSVTYAGFRSAYGGDWASRLRLVSLPRCALTTPGSADCRGTPLATRNDTSTGVLTATVAVRSTTSLIAVAAAASGPSGSYSATSLTASATWSAGSNSGNFSWSYPMQVPPPPGGPSPTVGLSYSSQSVDGRHAASNNQPSWIGEGFDAWPGYIERRYRNCTDDMDGTNNNTVKTADQCWATDNATMSLDGHAGELIYNATENRWHLRNDDGSSIERRPGASNGDDDGEHWVLTTVQGTQYWFGLNKLPGAGTQRTESTWTAPVFGNHPAEPCHKTAFKDSSCTQAYRWNLDYVVDRRGNTASYWYDKETNKYGRNIDQNDVVTYDRGGFLTRISYGTRQDGGIDSVFTGNAPAQVVFGVKDRCESDCATHDGAHWLDTPWDQECTKAPCMQFSPTFWSSKRLDTILTQVWSGSAYRDVDRWTLHQKYPDPGDGTRAGLWLSRISHEGRVGMRTTVPDVEFTEVQLSNRVDTIDHSPAMNWMRIAKIRNESGGTINVTYSPEECSADPANRKIPADPSTNTMRCYPVRWTPEGYTAPVTDWFHKYVVTTVYEIDQTGGAPPNGSPRIVHTYGYSSPAWHYTDDDGLIDAKNKTWSDWRGYRTVTETTGDLGEQTFTESRFFQGMHGDKLPSGRRTVTLPGAGVPTVNDEDEFSGMVREAITYNGPGGAEISRQVSEPWRSAPTASRTINKDTAESRFTDVQASHEREQLDGGRAPRVSSVRKTFDAYGMVTATDDAGDVAVTGDETCTQNTFEPRNITAWVMGVTHRIRTFAATCAQAANPAALTEAQVISDNRTSYDGHDWGVAADVGAATRIERMAAWNNGTPTFETIARSDHDIHGRVRHQWDALDKETVTEYTPPTGGPVTQTTVTNPLGHVTKVTAEPAWGVALTTVDANDKSTTTAYDGMGRLLKVWLPGRDASSQTPNMTYTYLVRDDAVSVVTTSALNAKGEYSTSYAMYDGLLRLRQTQSPSPSGGRLLTDKFYDTVGRQAKTYDAYYNASAPGTTLVTATDRTFVPSQTRILYDGAGRTSSTIFQPYNVERWRTRTSYGGDRVDVTPPAGGTATSTVDDIQGRVRTLRQFHGSVPTGDSDTSTFFYNRKGQLERVTDPAGNKWTYGYDLRGRQDSVTDPDRGTSSTTFDTADRPATSTDGRGETLAFQYDALGRKTAVFDDVISARPRARWIYDSIAKGQLTQSIRYKGTTAYITKITGYDNHYKPTGMDVVIPTSETGLNDTYHFDSTYKVDGSPASASYPAKGGLEAETVSYVYDETLALPNRMTTILGASEFSYVADTDYNALGQVDKLDLYTGLYSKTGKHTFASYTHELETRRLTGVRTDREALSPYTVTDMQYTYDNAGNITRVNDAAAAGSPDYQCFGYDGLRRLGQAWTPASGDCTAAASTSTLGGPAKYWLSWKYDSVGNRTEEVDRSTGTSRTTTYRYPAPGTPQPHALADTTTTVGTAPASTVAYGHDLAGNLKTRPTAGGTTQTLTWDSEGRVETVTEGTATTSYLYDADGNRLISSDPAGKTLYLPGQEIRFTASTAARTGTRYYAFAGQTVASRNNSGLTWLTADRQGTAQTSLDPVSQQATIRRQTPFGVPRGAATVWPNTKGFVGGTTDNTGLTHLGAREYDPQLGRFISVDPIMDLADPQQWTGYSYASNSPVTLSDPTGLIADDCSKFDCFGYNPKTGCKHGCGSTKNVEWGRKTGKTSTAPNSKRKHYSGHTPDGRSVPDKGKGERWTLQDYAEFRYNTSYADALANHLVQQDLCTDFGEMCSGLEEPTGISVARTLEGGMALLAIAAGPEILAACAVAPITCAYGVADDAAAFYGSGSLVGGVGMGLAGKTSAAGRAGGPCSFSGDTRVLLADGTSKKFKDLEKGDLVLATDPETGNEGGRLVDHVWVHFDDLYELSVGGKRLVTTEDHPYWNATDQSWERADELDDGDLLQTPDGRWARVGGMIPGSHRTALAYNLTVQDLHTYYVLAGKTPVLVHNTPCGPSSYYRGARDEAPSFVPRPNDYKVDPATGFVKETHGVSLFDNAGSISSKGFEPHGLDMNSVPSTLRIIQRGRDLNHYEIVPAPGANLTPGRYTEELSKIQCMCGGGG